MKKKIEARENFVYNSSSRSNVGGRFEKEKPMG